MNKVLMFILALAVFVSPAFAVESQKPASHDMSWIKRHGLASKVNPDECKECHIEKVACVRCHEDSAPRSHTSGWIKKGHGLEARWDRAKCAVCHKEDSCISCHQETPPSNHRPGWRAPLNRHCGNCHFPVQQTTCFTCHKSAHAPNQYSN